MARPPKKSRQLAPDPFPLFELGVPGEVRARDRAIGDVADLLIDVMKHAEKQPATTGPRGLKPEDARFLAYALVVYRTRSNKVLTEDHLRLLAAVLGVKRTPKGAVEFIGLPNVQDLTNFVAAADKLAEEPDISETRHARFVGVDRATIRAWRKMKSFRDRVRYVRSQKGNPTDEDRDIADRWKRVIEDANRKLAKSLEKSGG